MLSTQKLQDRFELKLRQYRREGKRVFASSSFQTHSIPMLHMISRFAPNCSIYFLETGFHFPETKAYRDAIAEMLGLRVVNLESPVPKIAQRDDMSRFLFASDPDRCCYLNKILPMEPILKEHDIWITGVRRDQTQFRSELKEEVSGLHDTLKYHPMLDWTSKMIWEYRKEYNLPEHPLEAQGYLSIGCTPCTRKWTEAEDRNSRWAGMTKEECGIHTEFIQNQN